MNPIPTLARVALVAALLLLGGCGPRTLKSWIWPERSTVASTVVFEDGGVITTQTIRYRCTILDESDSPAASVRHQPDGDVHWLKRRDGSLLVVGLLENCDVRYRKPGYRRVIGPSHRLRNHQAQVYNSAERPTQVRVVDRESLFAGPTPRILGAYIEVIPKTEIVRTIDTAFPGADSLVDPVPPDAGLVLRTHPMAWFWGVQAKVIRLDDGARCGFDTQGPGPFPVPKDDPCQNVQERGGDATQVHGRPVGFLPVRIDRPWARAEITLTEPDPREVAVVYRKRTMLAEGAPTEAGYEAIYWTPDACFGSHCVKLTSDRNVRPVRLYFPERGLLVELSAIEQAYGPVRRASRERRPPRAHKAP